MSSIHIRYIVGPSVAGLLLLVVPSLSTATEPWFAEPVVSTSPRPLAWPVVGDLNHDGIGDLVARATNASLGYVFLGNALGQMVLADSFPMGYAPTIVDENADGHSDIIWSAGSNTHIARNDGTGHFEYWGSHSNIGGQYAVGDLDGDDHVDLISTLAWIVTIIYGSAVGLDWADPQVLEMCWDIDGCAFLDVVIPDLDGDGRRDIVCVGGTAAGQEPESARITWRLATGSRQFGWYRTYTQGGSGDWFEQCDAGDVDLDGDSDLVCHSWWSIPDKLFLYDAVDNRFLPSGNPFSGAWYWIRLAMLNDDEFLDAISGDIETPYVHMGTGGGFDPIQDLPGATHFDIGDVLGSPGLDVVSVTWLGGPDIAVWENIVIPPAGLSEGSLSNGALRVWPSVTGSVVHILSSRQVEQPISVVVLDPSGRILRTLSFSGAEGLWDGRDDSGRLVPSGVYWLKSGTEGGAVRVTIMR